MSRRELCRPPRTRISAKWQRTVSSRNMLNTDVPTLERRVFACIEAMRGQHAPQHITPTQVRGVPAMATPTLATLKVKLFTDGADKAQIMEMAKQPWIAGFTTNPSLLKKAGVKNYAAYGRELVAAVPDRHISFEVFSDDIPEMVAQGRVIATWGRNVHVKLPVTNTKGEPLFEAVRALSRDGVNINMTAIFTSEQVARAVDALAGGAPACVSVFAGRLADLGLDYRPLIDRKSVR